MNENHVGPSIVVQASSFVPLLSVVERAIVEKIAKKIATFRLVGHQLESKCPIDFHIYYFSWQTRDYTAQLLFIELGIQVVVITIFNARPRESIKFIFICFPVSAAPIVRNSSKAYDIS